EAINLWDPISNLDQYLRNQKKDTDINSIGKDSQVDPTAKVTGPVIIGSNCEIKEGVLIRGGVIIGDNCVIGHGCEIKHSIMMSGTTIAHFNYIGDSVIGNRVNFAAGALTANFKHGTKNEIVNIENGGKKTPTGLRKFGSLVGDEAKIGCNAVLDPGTIIGKGTIVYPLAAIRGSIPANKIVKYRQSLEVVDQK
ncbi:MAG: hypothetical protein A2Z42_03345, partial [Candidatus Woykebacteria bacterium RBG_19FT_COMBO_43_10]